MRKLDSHEVPVLPTSAVSLKESTLGHCADYGNVLTEFQSNYGVLVVDRMEREPSKAPVHRLVLDFSTAEDADAFAARHNAKVTLVHDQTHKFIGKRPMHHCLGTYPFTAEGLLQIRDTYKISTIFLLMLK